MGGNKIASHVLVKSKKKTSVLKKGGTYLYDAFNLLYSLCMVAEIADLLGQEPPVPTRELVSLAVRP